MFSLFLHSIRYAKRIFWFSMIEWFLFIAIAFGLVMVLEALMEGASFMVLSYIGIGLIFMPLSQIRSVLLRLDETNALEVGKIMPTTRMLMRFWGVILPVPTAISAILLIGVWKMGFVNDIPLLTQTDNLATAARDTVFVAGGSSLLQAAIVLVALIYVFTLSLNMVPLAAIAANLGNAKSDLDPFFGIGAYKYKAFFMTVAILVLDAVVIGAAAYSLYSSTLSSLELGTINPPYFEPGFLAIIGITLTLLIFLQNIWFSACGLMFSLHREDAKNNETTREHQMYGHAFDDHDLRALRKAREAR